MLSASALPILLALATAVTFAVSATLVRFGVKESSPLVALVVTLTINVIVLWSITFLVYDVTVDVWAWRYFVLAGVFAPALGRLCNYIGIQRVGVNLSVPISNSNPVVAVILAVLFLGEELSPVGAAGIVLVVGGGVLISSVGGDETGTIDRRYLVFPVLGAMFYGVVQVIREVGLTLVPAPALGAAVNLSTSWVIVAAYVLTTDRLERADIRSRELRFFVPAGLLSSLGLVLLYTALELGQVVIVTPILNTTPLFALGTTFVFARQSELFTWRVHVGTVSIVLGVSLLSVVIQPSLTGS